MSTPNVDGNSHQVNPQSAQEVTDNSESIWGEEFDGYENGKRAVAESQARQAAQREADEKVSATLRKEPDLVKRAKSLAAGNFISFPDVKKRRVGDVYLTLPEVTDQNIWTILDAMFKDVDGEEVPKPHRNMFVGRIVDHDDEIIDEQYPVTKWVPAFAAAGLKGVSADRARKQLKEWALDKSRCRNDLIDRLVKLIPNWDGVPRMRSFLINTFESHDTELNQDFGEYFWLSLYARLMVPGTQAPMVLSLFGVQNCGKSFFGKRICQLVMGDEEADTVQLDLGGDKIDFLREITGQSVIAAVGEMTGLVRGDLNKIKDFITRTGDKMHYKYEGHFTQLRQWITIMDGNKYAGLQRDETGNRRFYPMFCGQLPDEMGTPRWREDFRAGEFIASNEFASAFWQLMAEAAAWFVEKGTKAYDKLVADVSNKVFAFSAEQMRLEAGTVDDEQVGPYIDEALRRVDKLVVKKRVGGSDYVAIRRADLFAAMDAVAGRSVSAERGFGIGINKAVKARGGSDKTAIAVKIDGRTTTESAYKFMECSTVEEFEAAINNRFALADDEFDEADEAKGKKDF